MKSFRLAKWRFVLLVLAIVIVVGETRPVAAAPVVTLWLSPNDDGFGNGGGFSTPGKFAIYAFVSPENGGLFAFGVDLTGNITSFFNLAPQGEFRKTGSATKFLGFGAGVTEDAGAGKISGVQDLGRGLGFIPTYGFGQVSGDLNTLKPVGYNNYFDTNPNAPGSVYNAQLLLGVGTYQGDPSAFVWQAGSLDNRASVFDDCTGMETLSALLNLTRVNLGDGTAVLGPGANSSEAVVPCAVPEPGVMGLVGLGMILLGRRRR